jgi:hypothetical protein
MAMLSMMSPRKVKEIRFLSAAVEDWEVKVKGLGAEHDTTIDPKITSAVLTAMCPEEVQSLIFQWMDTKTRYDELRDKVVALSQIRAGGAKPKPIEVDYVKDGSCDWWAWDGGEQYEPNAKEESEKEVEVDYVGESCLRCGGLGHYTTECPTPKCKGKGGGKSGKGYGKDGFGYKGYKGGGKDGFGYKGTKGNGKDGYCKNNYDKGKGKGFAGQCFVCGEAGHRAVNCPSKKGGTNMEIGAVAEATVGGVWEIATAEEWCEVTEGGKFHDGSRLAGCSPRACWGGPEGFSRGACQHRNRFEALEVGESEESEEEWPKVGEVAYVPKGKLRCTKYERKAKDDEKVVKEDRCGPCFAAFSAVPFASCRGPLGLDVGEVVGIKAGEKEWRKVGMDEITIDSAAEESVCPRQWATAFGTGPRAARSPAARRGATENGS